jgi:hypothetical protein
MDSELPKPPKKRMTLVGIMNIYDLEKAMEECVREHYKSIELSMGIKENGEYYSIFCAEDE